MNAYLYSLLLNAEAISGMCLMGWFVWKGASTWLVLVAFLFSLAIVVPGRKTFTCPKCGHTGTLSVFKIGFDSGSLPQMKQEEKDNREKAI